LPQFYQSTDNPQELFLDKYPLMFTNFLIIHTVPWRAHTLRSDRHRQQRGDSINPREWTVTVEAEKPARCFCDATVGHAAVVRRKCNGLGRPSPRRPAPSADRPTHTYRCASLCGTGGGRGGSVSNRLDRGGGYEAWVYRETPNLRRSGSLHCGPNRYIAVDLATIR
jgi:hypothetical protein